MTPHMMKRRCLASVLACLLGLAGCASVPSPADRRSHADALADQHSWHAVVLSGLRFDITGYVPRRVRADAVLDVYIEGDGLAWLSSDLPSPDPTPRDPVALRMALAQPEGNAAYLARPCQYRTASDTNSCDRAYWTNARFAEEVVTAMNAALSTLKTRYGAERIRLVGYSGGGAVAALLAARRDDVSRLVTVAGNLDTERWVRLHRISPLLGSSNPADQALQLRYVRQAHLVGARDKTVPIVVAQAYASRFPLSSVPDVRLLEGYDHTCCWAENWAVLWKTLP